MSDLPTFQMILFSSCQRYLLPRPHFFALVWSVTYLSLSVYPLPRYLSAPHLPITSSSSRFSFSFLSPPDIRFPFLYARAQVSHLMLLLSIFLSLVCLYCFSPVSSYCYGSLAPDADLVLMVLPSSRLLHPTSSELSCPLLTSSLTLCAKCASGVMIDVFLHNASELLLHSSSSVRVVNSHMGCPS